MQASFSNTAVAVIGPKNNTDLPVLSQVALNADGSTFYFDYTNSLQVSKITRKSFDNEQRAQTSFTYQTPSNDAPRLIDISVSASNWTGINGVPSSVSTSYAVSGNTYSMTVIDGTVTEPFLTVYSETYGTGWKKGLVTGTEIVSGGVVRKWTTTSWEQDTADDYETNPRVKETNIYDAGGNRRKTTIEYWPQFGLPHIIAEYARDATNVLRYTFFDYKDEPTYTDRRIIGLVFRQTVLDGSWNLQSKTEYGYDWDWNGDMFQDTPASATQHDRTNYGPSFIVGRGNRSQMARFDITDPNNTNNTAIETKWRVNSTGSVLMERDHLWHQKFIAYGDSFSDSVNRNTFAYPTTMTDADGFSSYMQYNFDFGATTRTQGPPPAGQSQGAIQTMQYYASGQLERVTTTNNGAYKRFWYGPDYTASYSTVNSANDEAYSTQTFDGLGRTIGNASNHPGIGSAGYKAQITVYDQRGRAIKVSNPAEITGSWVPAGDDAAGWLYTQQTYDWKGRPWRTTNPDTTYKEADYSGCGCAGGEVVTLTDEGTLAGGVQKRRQQKIYSDVLGRTWKTEVLNWDGSGPNGTAPGNSVYSATVNTYNMRDQVTAVRQYAGPEFSGTYQDTTMTYDGFGRLKTEHVPEQTAGLVTTYNYNADDTLLSKVDARGASATYGYNSRHLVTGITYNAPSGSGITIPGAVSYSYDAVGNRTVMTDGLGSTNYSYNQLSKITSETRHFNGPPSANYTIAYQYNLAGQLTSITDPRNITVNYTLNSVGELTAVTGSNPGGSATYATNIKHRAWGGLKHQQYGNGYTADATYNSRLQAATFQVSGTNPQILKTYSYYDDGTLKFSSDSFDHRFDRSYTWDHANRIKEAYSGAEARGEAPTHDRPYNQIYSYDAFNHLTDRIYTRWSNYQNTSDTYHNNRHDPVFTLWSYDDDGNVLNPPGMSYNYDAAGQIAGTQLFAANSTTTINWDGDGKPVKAVEVIHDPDTNTDTTITTYHVMSSVLGQELTEIGDWTVRTFVYAEGTVLAYHEGGPQPQYDQIWYEHRDPGNATLRTTSNYSSVGLSGEFDPTGADAGTWNGMVESVPDEGALTQYPSINNPSQPNMTYSVDGIRVPLDHFMPLIEMAFHGNMGLMEAMARTTSTVVGSQTSGVSWGRRFTQVRDVNGRITSWGSFDPSLAQVSYSSTSNIYGEASLGLLSALFEPQNTSLNPFLVNRVKQELSESDCAKFAETILNQLAPGKGRNLVSVFEAFLTQAKAHDLLTRVKPTNCWSEACTTGTIKESTAAIWARRVDVNQTKADADNIVAELFHLARMDGLYTDKQLANAARRTEYASEAANYLAPSANVFDPGYKPGGWTEQNQFGYSVYFHVIQQQHCGFRPPTGRK